MTIIAYWIIYFFIKEQDQPFRLGQIAAQNFKGIAQNDPPAGVHTGKLLLCRGHLNHHRAGQLNIHLYIIQVGEHFLQLSGLFHGGEPKQITVLFDSQGCDDFFLGINAGVSRRGSVKGLYPESRYFEQLSL